MRLFALLVLIASCDRVLGLQDVTPKPDASAIDAPGGGSDAPADAPPGMICAGGAYLHPCVPIGSTSMYTVSAAAAIDTTMGTPDCTTFAQSAGAPDVCMKVVGDASITTKLTVHGTRPFVLVAMGDLTIGTNGTIDASSSALVHGPGANYPGGNCTEIAGTSQTTARSTAGGGAGGGFGDAGGAGGTDFITSTTATRGPKVSGLTFVRGGCGGGSGGANAFAVQAASGGNSGGAVYLIASGTITLQGRVLANGIGGGGGGPLVGNGNAGDFGGGGGGGSGGMIVLDATSLVITSGSVLQASGGGGGGGQAGATSGQNGASPVATAPNTAANGGAGAGAGGPGSLLDVGGDGLEAMPQGGSGGGGGGAGIIKLFPADSVSAGTIMPPAG